MRVLHVTPSYAPAYALGGPVRSLEGLVRQLVRDGLEVRVLTTDSEGAGRVAVPRGWVGRDGAQVRYWRRWLAPDLAPGFGLQAARAMRQADVVHVTGVFSAPSLQALGAARLTGRPVVLSPRGVLEPAALTRREGLKAAWLRAARPLLQGVRVFHATTAAEAEGIRAALGPVPVRVVPNGVSLSEELPQDEDDPPVIAALGRIHPVKAYERLLEAAARLKEAGQRFVVRIAGPIADEAYAASLQEQLGPLGLEGVVQWVGPRWDRERDRFLARARVLVLPSLHESFGNVVVEALACGTPVVASRATPWGLLEETGCGRWVEPEAMADAIAPFLEDPELAQEAGARGRELVGARFSWERVAADMTQVYEAACCPGTLPA